jgi:hypothetical protein
VQAPVSSSRQSGTRPNLSRASQRSSSTGRACTPRGACMGFGPLCAGCLPRSHTLWTLAGYWLRRLNPTMTQTFLFRKVLHRCYCLHALSRWISGVCPPLHYLFTDLQAPILLRRVFFVVPTRPSPIKATNDCTVTSAACLEIVG